MGRMAEVTGDEVERFARLAGVTLDQWQVDAVRQLLDSPFDMKASMAAVDLNERRQRRALRQLVATLFATR